MKLLAALAISSSVLMAQDARLAQCAVTAIRSWSLGDVTRVAIEISGDFEFRSDRLHNPERVYFDILNARPRLESKRLWSKDVDDRLVQRIRVAETAPGKTRIVLDLSGAVEVSTSQLSNPNRLMIEMRNSAAPAIPPETHTAAAPTASLPLRPPVIRPDPPKATPPPPRPAAKPEPAAKLEPARVEVSLTPVAKEELPAPPPLVRPVAEPLAEAPVPRIAPLAEVGKAAKHTSSGQSSLTRALGLKVARVVIDPGHGGHDRGTEGPKGLLEKELVLDVAQRVGKLIDERMNAEVIYTRSDDSFIPLERRTAMANERKADLFLSIHANSSPISRIAGVETFYLNFTDSREALDVAARENAVSQKSIFELQDIIQKITLHDKLEESKEFASRIQTSLFTFSSRTIPGQKNRGIKKAPFVVLIGANMPSVLAEIGFLSNPREELLLKKPEYRQKLAEALFRGVSRYAESLSHFQLAHN